MYVYVCVCVSDYSQLHAFAALIPTGDGAGDERACAASPRAAGELHRTNTTARKEGNGDGDLWCTDVGLTPVSRHSETRSVRAVYKYY